MAYRKGRDDGCWHNCRSCSKWPGATTETLPAIPPGESGCLECAGLILSHAVLLHEDGSWELVQETCSGTNRR